MGSHTHLSSRRSHLHHRSRGPRGSARWRWSLCPVFLSRRRLAIPSFRYPVPWPPKHTGQGLMQGCLSSFSEPLKLSWKEQQWQIKLVSKCVPVKLKPKVDTVVQYFRTTWNSREVSLMVLSWWRHKSRRLLRSAVYWHLLPLPDIIKLPGNISGNWAYHRVSDSLLHITTIDYN